MSILPGSMGRLRLLLGANVAFAAGLFVHGFAYNFYLESLGYSPLEMGRAQAALTAGGLVALLPAGRLVDRIGPRACITLAAVATAFGLAAGAIAEHLVAIYLFAFVAGAGIGAWRVAGGPLMLAAAPPEHLARGFSWNIGLMVAAGGGLLLASGAVAERLGGVGLAPDAAQRVTLLGGAALTAIAIALFWRLRLGPGRATGAPGTSAASRGLPDARLGLVVLAVFVWMLAGAMTVPFANLYFARGHGLSLTTTGALLGALQLATALVLLAGAELAQRKGLAAALRFWTLLMPPALALLAVGPALAPAIALFAVQGFAPPATYPLIDQLVLEGVEPARRGHAASWRTTATEASGVAGAALGGVVLAAASFETLYAAAAGAAAAGALCLALVLRSRR